MSLRVSETEMLKKRSGIKALHERQRTGKWPIALRQLPSLHVPALHVPTLF